MVWNPALPAISQPAGVAVMVPLWGADGTPLGGCQGEALKYSKLMHGSSPSQRLPAVLLSLVRVSHMGTLDAGKHALKHPEMVIRSIYLGAFLIQW